MGFLELSSPPPMGGEALNSLCFLSLCTSRHSMYSPCVIRGPRLVFYALLDYLSKYPNNPRQVKRH